MVLGISTLNLKREKKWKGVRESDRKEVGNQVTKSVRKRTTLPVVLLKQKKIQVRLGATN